MADPAFLIIPGWRGSGAAHWQTIWEVEHPEYRRAEQHDWMNPYRPEWVGGIERAVLAAPGEVLLVAHSLGCLTVVWWAVTRGCSADRVCGTLLVAPPDLGTSGCLPALASFAPVPQFRLPFRSILVASRNDPYATFAASAAMAETWGCELIDAGLAGHINTDSGHGRWPEGEAYLQRLVQGHRPATELVLCKQAACEPSRSERSTD